MGTERRVRDTGQASESGEPDGGRDGRFGGWTSNPASNPRAQNVCGTASLRVRHLNYGPWYRRSPFFDATLRAGCSAYDVYQHMLHPNTYGDPVEEYWALVNDVTLWDVGVERIVEITGPDASAFTNLLTCRDLTTCQVKQGKYVLITAADGGIVNDPVLLRDRGPNRWWLALADSDAGLYAMGIAAIN